MVSEREREREGEGEWGEWGERERERRERKKRGTGAETKRFFPIIFWFTFAFIHFGKRTVRDQ